MLATAPVDVTPVQVNPTTGRNMTCTGLTMPGGPVAATVGSVRAAAAYCEAVAFVATYTVDPQMLEHDPGLLTAPDFDHVLPFLAPATRPRWQALVRRALADLPAHPSSADLDRVRMLVLFGFGPEQFPDGYAQINHATFSSPWLNAEGPGVAVRFVYRADVPMQTGGKVLTFHVTRITRLTLVANPSPTLPWLITDWHVDGSASYGRATPVAPTPPAAPPAAGAAA